MNAEAQFQREVQSGLASNDNDSGPQPVERDTSPDEECHFEIFRKDESRMTSTLFSGGDWRWRLVTSGRLLLAEGYGYSSAVACRAAVEALQKRAAQAPIVGPGEQA